MTGISSTSYLYGINGNLTTRGTQSLTATDTVTGTQTNITVNSGSTPPAVTTNTASNFNTTTITLNGNLTTQTDAKNQTITMVYDALNRLTNKNYPAGSGMTNVAYTYDDTANGNYGKGQRTGMMDAVSDAAHPSTYKYDVLGRLVQEVRWEYSNSTWNSYTTGYSYDGADRIYQVTYPTVEVVTNTFNGRSLPYGVTGTLAGNVVSSTLYNALGSMTEINLGNPNVLQTTYGYYGTGGAYDTTGGYYGKLWEIKTTQQPGGTPVLQDVKYTWDAGGNLNSRETVGVETENFSYDFLDRLLTASGTAVPAYSDTYTYDPLGNIATQNGLTYTYNINGVRPHAVTAYNGTSYVYDNNGNMTTRVPRL